MKIVLALAALLAPTVAASAEAPAAEPTYLVSISLRDGDRLVAEPRLTVLANGPGQIEIGDKEGNRYDMRFTVSPQGGDVVAFRSSLAVARASGARHEAAPVLLVRAGSTGAISFQDEGMDRPFHATVRISPATAGH
jgi:hypothetical protein